MATATATHTRSPTNRGRGGGAGSKGRRGRGAKSGPPRGPADSTKPDSLPAPGAQAEASKAASSEAVADSTSATADTAVDDGTVCWICAEPVKYWSVSECNHRTCHVCALRLRALYKKTECTFCKEPQPSVIFTTSADALWASYTPETIPYKDAKLSISFETQEMMEETLILLRFNCPGFAMRFHRQRLE
uniref:Reducing polyketide synthase FUB1 ) n=1 Tax=Ganoderma boninense TaxID=34458 RepID=A0A5K1K0H7_9APHY|nr:Reducing polyketide synthase FUB1 (EC (Fusaric acid biosynthesis protein 1) [Ganoderma boninense]